MKNVKYCGNCQLPKSFEDFYLRKANKDGRQNFCKICSNIKNKEHYYKNRKTVDDKIEESIFTLDLATQQKYEVALFSLIKKTNYRQLLTTLREDRRKSLTH